MTMFQKSKTYDTNSELIAMVIRNDFFLFIGSNNLLFIDALKQRQGTLLTNETRELFETKVEASLNFALEECRRIVCHSPQNPLKLMVKKVTYFKASQTSVSFLFICFSI
ncbi:unnamed protein product [Cylicocyclus nassatus]|uniref:Uncharacterized protein n=1 Tax=Cylicocyclus nassatus TaxID=53992 RepID=A0AA36MAT5_CYLNA|nr:unnamed protein product [Cylicocyclus nassatus]